jgi:hypothetical protein
MADKKAKDSKMAPGDMGCSTLGSKSLVPDNSKDPDGAVKRMFLTPENAKEMMAPSPAVQKVLYARLESLSVEEVKTLDTVINVQTAPVLAKIFPELGGLIAQATSMRKPLLPGKTPEESAAAGTQDVPPGGGPASQGTIPSPGAVGPASHGQGATQVAPVDPNQMFGFADGGFVNKGIPDTSFAKGGMAIAPPPHASAPFRPEMPAMNKTASRKFNTVGMADGGFIPESFACGGTPQGPAQGLGAPQGDPQAAQNQDVAQSIVPKEGTSDSVPAKLSKGEFVLDAATVQFFGVDKIIKMQEKAHQGIAEHLAQQDANQKQAQQAPQAQPQPQQQPAGLGAPPPQMPNQTAPQPNATDQRIQATDTPKPQNSPLSMMA